MLAVLPMDAVGMKEEGSGRLPNQSVSVAGEARSDEGCGPHIWVSTKQSTIVRCTSTTRRKKTIRNMMHIEGIAEALEAFRESEMSFPCS